MTKLNKKSISFILFDWGTSPLPTIHTTFIFSVYFINLIAVNNGTFIWGCIVGFAGILTACFGPLIGSYSDKKGNRKFILLILILLGVASTALLWFARPGSEYLFFATIFSCISILSMELIFVLYNSLLSKTSSKSSVGEISGYAWSAGYIGGIISLIICLILFILPEKLPFGIPKENGSDVRSCMLFISFWLMIFCIPLFIYVEEPKQNKTTKSTLIYIKDGLKKIYNSKNVLRYFVARIFYFDGLATLFAFGGIYAYKVFEFNKIEILYFAIIINLSAALGAIFGGYFDDKFSPFRVIRLSLFGLIIFGIMLILNEDKNLFWIISFFLGLFIGPLQSSSRVLITKITPEKKGAQFFGFAIFSGKITSFVGPLIYGSLVFLFESQKFGMMFVITLFIVSLIILGNKEPNKIK